MLVALRYFGHKNSAPTTDLLPPSGNHCAEDKSDKKAVYASHKRRLRHKKDFICRIYDFNDMLDPLRLRYRARFVELVETEIMSLHEGNIARYKLRPTEY